MDFDELDEIFDAEVGEGHDAVIADAVDPEDAVLRFHFIGDVVEPVDAFAVSGTIAPPRIFPRDKRDSPRSIGGRSQIPCIKPGMMPTRTDASR